MLWLRSRSQATSPMIQKPEQAQGYNITPALGTDGSILKGNALARIQKPDHITNDPEAGTRSTASPSP